MGFASTHTVQTMLTAQAAIAPGSTFMVIKFSESHPGKIVASYIAWTPQGVQFIEHVIFNDDENAIFKNRSIVECVKMSPNLQSVNLILPCNATLADFYALEARQSEARGTRGYVKPRIAFIWG